MSQPRSHEFGGRGLAETLVSTHPAVAALAGGAVLGGREQQREHIVEAHISRGVAQSIALTVEQLDTVNGGAGNTAPPHVGSGSGGAGAGKVTV